MADIYAVQADAAYAFPFAGGAVLLYKGAPFPADSTNLDQVVADGLVVKVEASYEPGGIASDDPSGPVIPADKVIKPGPVAKQASK